MKTTLPCYTVSGLTLAEIETEDGDYFQFILDNFSHDPEGLTHKGDNFVKYGRYSQLGVWAALKKDCGFIACCDYNPDLCDHDVYILVKDHAGLLQMYKELLPLIHSEDRTEAITSIQKAVGDIEVYNDPVTLLEWIGRTTL